MRVPSAPWLAKYMRATGLLIAGGIIGGAFFMVLYAHSFNTLYMENQRLKSENQEMRKTLDPLLQNKSRMAVISQIKLGLFSTPGSEPLSELTTLQLKRQLANDLETLRGRRTEGIEDSLLVARRIIGRKVYTLDRDQEYTMELVLIMIRSSELMIWSEVKPYIRAD